MVTAIKLPCKDAGEGILFSPDNLVVVRGDRAVVDAVDCYGKAGHDGNPALAPELRTQVNAIVQALNALAPHTPVSDEVSSVTRLNIANTFHCNMGCTYCYNELAIKHRKGSESPGGMTREVARQAVDRLVEQAAEGAPLSLVFIGGEPLIEKDVLLETVAYAHDRTARAGHDLKVSVYTNGLRMDREVIEWANSYHVSLVVSLDGPPAIHDKHRVLRSGAPTSKRVLQNIALLMEHSTHNAKRVRSVVTDPRNLLPLHRYLLDLGFNEIHVQAAYSEKGFSGGISDAIELLQWYEGHLLSANVIGIAPFEGFLQRLALRRAATASWFPCTAGVSALGVGPDGKLYPCHHFIEEPDFQIGRVGEGLPTHSERKQWFKRVDQREPCTSCWARHVCGGECYHRAHTAGRGYDGTLEAVCVERKSLIGLTVELFSNIMAGDVEIVRRLLRQQYSHQTPNWQAYTHDSLDPYLSTDSGAPATVC